MLKQKQLWLTPFLMIMLAGSFYCYEYILRISPSVMIPELMKSFSIQATHIGVLSSFYYWGYAMGSILVGPFVDKYGPRKVLFWAAIACAIGTCFFASSESLLMANMSRFSVGLGSAFAFIGVLKIGALWLPGQYFGRLAGLCSMLGTASGMMGQIWLSTLMEHMSWQVLSVYSASVGGIIAILLFLFLKDKPDSVGYASPNSEMQSKETFAQLFNAFKKIGKRGVFWQNCIIGFTTFLPIIAFADLWGIPFMQENYGITREVAALQVSMVFLGWSLGGPTLGYLYDKFKNWQAIFLIGTGVAFLSSALILFYPMPLDMMRYVLLLFGFSASSHVLVFVGSKKMSTPEIEGTTLGVTNLFMMSAGVFVQPCIGIIIDYFIPMMDKLGLTFTTIQSYQCALSLIPLSLVFTLYLIKLVSRVVDQQDEDAEKNTDPRLSLTAQLSMLRYQSWPGNRYMSHVEESPGSTGQSAR